MENFNLYVSMLSLTQHDLDAAVSFYKKLGLPLTFHVEKKWAEFDIQGLRLFLYQVDEELPDRYTGIAVHVDDLMAFHEAMREQGVEFTSEPNKVDYAIVASIKDPGNNIIGLVQPTPEAVQEMLDKKNGKKVQNQEDCCQQGCGCE